MANRLPSKFVERLPQKRIDEAGVQGLKPGQDLWEMILEGAREPVQQSGLVIDELPPLLDAQLQSARLMVRRAPGPELVLMLLEKL